MKTKILGLLAVGLLAGSMGAGAGTVTHTLSSTYSGQDPLTSPYITLYDNIGTADAAAFGASANSTNDVVARIGLGAGSAIEHLTNFFMNSVLATSTLNLAFLNVAATNNNATVSFGSDSFQASAAGGFFDIQVALPPPPNDPNSTLTAGESILLLFTRNTAGTLDVSNFVASAFSVSQLFAARVSGLDNGGIGWNTVGSASVPEPGTLALLGLGLAGLGLSRRRKAH